MSQICVLKRITTKDHQNSDKFSQIQLKNDFNQIYIGRDVDCNYRISSIEISRKHALLEYSSDDHFWTISDLNSTNGLFVNSVQLQPYNPYRLVNGDKVSFGPPNQSQFCYQFVDNSVYELPAIGLTAIPVIPIVTRIQTNSTTESVLTSGLHIGIEANQSRTISLTSTMPTRSGLNYAVSTTRAPRSSVGNSLGNKKVMSRKASADSSERQTLADHDYTRNSFSAKYRKSASKRLKLKTGQADRGPQGRERAEDHKTKTSKTSESERKLIAKERARLEKSKKNLEQQQTKTEQRIMRREEEIKKKQKELERKEREAKKREEEIENMRKELMKEKTLLEKKRLEFVKTERESAKRKLRPSPVTGTNENKRQCKDEEKNVIEDLLESELICSICSEYFIQAVNLNCSHTFCEHCIEEWKRQNDDDAVCPICRHPIENQNRQLVLDHLIDQFITQTKPSLVEHRKKVAEERAKAVKKVSHNGPEILHWSTDSSDSDSEVSSDDSSDSSLRSARLISNHRFIVDSNSWANLSIDVFDVSDVSDDFELTSSLSSWSSDDNSDSDSDDSLDDSSSGSDSDDSDLSVLTVD